MLKAASPSTASSLSSKDDGTWDIPGTRIGGVGIEGGHLVPAFGAGELVVKAQPSSDGQTTIHLELIVDPGRRVGFVEHRMERNGLCRRMDLSQQEGGKRFAGLAVEIVTSSVITSSLQT